MGLLKIAVTTLKGLGMLATNMVVNITEKSTENIISDLVYRGVDTMILLKKQKVQDMMKDYAMQNPQEFDQNGNWIASEERKKEVIEYYKNLMGSN